MPRIPRRFEEGRFYHVYNRFSRGEPIFEESVEVGRFLDLLSEVKQTDGFALLAFCILPVAGAQEARDSGAIARF